MTNNFEDEFKPNLDYSTSSTGVLQTTETGQLNPVVSPNGRKLFSSFPGVIRRIVWRNSKFDLTLKSLRFQLRDISFRKIRSIVFAY